MVMMNPAPTDRSRPDLAVSINLPMSGTVVTDCFVSASNLVEPIFRTCFAITRLDNDISLAILLILGEKLFLLQIVLISAKYPMVICLIKVSVLLQPCS